MDHFEYVDGSLHCESVSLESLAEAVNTPAYVYSSATFIDHVSRIRQAFAELDPLNGMVYVHMARCVEKMDKDKDEVKRLRQLALEVDPDNYSVFLEVGFETDVEVKGK